MEGTANHQPVVRCTCEPFSVPLTDMHVNQHVLKLSGGDGFFCAPSIKKILGNRKMQKLRTLSPTGQTYLSSFCTFVTCWSGTAPAQDWGGWNSLCLPFRCDGFYLGSGETRANSFACISCPQLRRKHRGSVRDENRFFSFEIILKCIFMPTFLYCFFVLRSSRWLCALLWFICFATMRISIWSKVCWALVTAVNQ